MNILKYIKKFFKTFFKTIFFIFLIAFIGIFIFCYYKYYPIYQQYKIESKELVANSSYDTFILNETSYIYDDINFCKYI